MNKRDIKRVLTTGTALLFLLTGCEYTQTGSRLMIGNYIYSRGNYQQATYHYLVGGTGGNHDGRVRFNIGNAYNALGESEAALDIWLGLEGDPDLLVRFRLYFNRGLINYQLGRYEKAQQDFIEALRINPDSYETKINLEFTLKKLAPPAEQNEDASSLPSQTGTVTVENSASILDYAREREKNVLEREESIASVGDDW